MTISTEEVKARLAQLIDPVTGTDYVSSRMLKDVETDAQGGVVVRIALGYPAKFRGECRGRIGRLVREGGGDAGHHCA